VNGRNAEGGGRADVTAAVAAGLLFLAAAVTGHAIDDEHELFLPYPPLHARWAPHVGPGTPAALLVAGLVLLYGPAAARRLAWRPLLAAAGAGSLAWLWSLALIDGWQRGVVGRLTAHNEYLVSVDAIDAGNLGHFLGTFTDHILFGTEDRWPAHVAGHPPGAVLTFVALDRVGLGGGGWAGAFCVTASATIAVAVAVTVRALAGEETARRALPFLVLAPAGIWLAASADGYFAAVGAWALALLALAATRAARWPRLAALGSGLLFGLLLYLSYGMVLLGIPALAVLLLARTWRPLPYALAGIAAWVAAFTAAGFWWFDGYATLTERYYQGAAASRPYAYFVWANLAVQVLSAGLATVAGLRRTVAALPRAGRAAAGSPGALLWLAAAGLAAMLVADLSGMSKAETERIWLPFAVWLLPATALLPPRHTRAWLAAQAVLALAVNHLWITRW
jgi:methylthioxylose transferase